MDEIGDFMMMVGFAMLALGGIGLAIVGIVTAFMISLPLGFLAVVMTGLIVGVIGQMIAEA